jgi:hypothetical protein
MPCPQPTDRGSRAPVSTSHEDEIVERSLLTQALVLFPAQLTILELAQRLERDPDDFAQKDAVERAVRELSRDGLLVCDCQRIAPSRAALRFDRLIGGVS